MDGIVLKRFRRIYYTGMILLILIISASLSIPMFQFQRQEYERMGRQLNESVMEQKRTYIKWVILEKFSDIEETERLLQSYEEDKIALFAEQIAILGEDSLSRNTIPDVKSLLERSACDCYTLTIKDRETGEIRREGISRGEAYLTKEIPLGDRYSLTLTLSREAFEEILKERVIESIRTTELPENEYIWVNGVIDYGGGDDYAVRLVHPNLPHTEGAFLSTKTEDIKGNTPYLEELKGIKKGGEVYLEYYFKELTSDRISHKLSYARLYERFDWIIATGVYLNDVDDLVEAERRKMEEILRRELNITLLVTVLVVAVALMALIRFEALLQRVIEIYVKQLEDMNARLENYAFRDPLTNLLNRRAMYDRLKEEIARSSRSGDSFCVILADLDHFKKVNDTWGHSAGDRVLKGLSKLMTENVRITDAVSRWGGEEFLLLIGSADLSAATITAEKVRRKAEAHRFAEENGEISITLTLGVSEHRAGESLEEMIQRADENLYKGKEGGRNRVVSQGGV